MRVWAEYVSWEEWRDAVKWATFARGRVIAFHGAQMVGGVEAQSLFFHGPECGCLPCHDRLMMERVLEEERVKSPPLERRG